MAIDDSIELDSNNSNTESSAFLPQLLTPRYVCMHATLLLPFVCLVVQTLMYVMYVHYTVYRSSMVSFMRESMLLQVGLPC